MTNVTGAMVAEEVVEFGEGSGDVLLAAAVNNIDPLAGVGVEKQQEMFLVCFASAVLERAHCRRSVARANATVGDCKEEKHPARNCWTPRKFLHMVHINFSTYRFVDSIRRALTPTPQDRKDWPVPYS